MAPKRSSQHSFSIERRMKITSTRTGTQVHRALELQLEQASLVSNDGSPAGQMLKQTKLSAKMLVTYFLAEKHFISIGRDHSRLTWYFHFFCDLLPPSNNCFLLVLASLSSKEWQVTMLTLE